MKKNTHPNYLKKLYILLNYLYLNGLLKLIRKEIESNASFIN